MDMPNKKVTSQLNNIPGSPGIYLMKNEKDELIYVGKAKDLKKRVTSYFRKSSKPNQKTQKLVSEISSLEYVETRSDIEALILETNYIKENKPKYNILMRDDKNHLYIKITKSEDYPRIYTVRNIVKDGSLYFGPKTSGIDVKRTLKLLRKLFPYRTCTLDIVDKGDSVEIKKKTINYPCIYYHIKRCLGPCIKQCNPDYRQLIDNIVTVLEGNYKDVIHDLQGKMEEHAKHKRFEKAIASRDLITSLHALMEKQNITQTDPTMNTDVVGVTNQFDKFFFHLFQIRNGKLIGHENFTFDSKLKEDTDESELLTTFLMQYYTIATSFPNEIMIPNQIQDEHLIKDFITNISHKSIDISYPQRGKKRDLIALATQNAESFAYQQKASWELEDEKTVGALENLKKALVLADIPKRIECYDISHLGGTSTVGSMIVFIDGKPSKKDYRRFTIKTLPDGTIDDFASLEEVLSRRLKALKSTETNENTPDLIIIDGGKGQLSSVMSVAQKLDIDIPIVSLAKQEEEIFLPYEKDSIILPRNSKELYLVQNIRDEAHRFAISFNRNLRAKKQHMSILDKIPGIGPKKKKLLLKTFGDVHGIALATIEDLTPLVGEKVATTIKEII